ncbi:hypothetical protein PSTG_04816 [Puccinia striiformis f. sp. tritici PST-78]|uniref:Tet-like 2OG-Fe(II) oxygenase domain-containing protein n=1 Tax=Puccinia striiformis f. sp. tritici PST-78 TaxID=1165861 RepID=A0A0L0VS17_9BASI|nr:hypothetical protein PSTG_04816 [Puccinia striiformis f. sp. tritici PST-78]
MALFNINKRKHNKSRRLAKYRYQIQKKIDKHASFHKNVIGISNKLNPLHRSIRWERVKFDPLNLYPSIPLNKNDQPIRAPTPEEIEEAYKTVKNSFFLIRSGRVVIRDPLDKSSLIAIMEFTPWSELTNQDKRNLNFLSTFLHNSKKFINPVSSSKRTWGGRMWAIGWRKSQDFMQIVGRYIKNFTPAKMDAYHDHFKKSARAGRIIGKYFKELGSVPFLKNQTLMKKYNLPSFDSLSFGTTPKDSDCSPHITFTTDGFFNPPHIDKKDVSEYAFVLFLPTFSDTGALAPPNSGYDITSGPFVFPDHKIGINFDYQHGIVKMIWKANRYTHCTLPPSSSSRFTRLGMSLQINFNLMNACKKNEEGYYKDFLHYFGDHFHYMFRSLWKAALLATSLLSLLFLLF